VTRYRQAGSNRPCRRSGRDLSKAGVRHGSFRRQQKPRRQIASASGRRGTARHPGHPGEHLPDLQRLRQIGSEALPGLRRDWQSRRRDRWRVARADRASLDRRNNEAFCCRSLCLFFLSNAAAADTNELRIAKQPGLSYLPAVIAEKLQLVEKQARAAGLADFKTTWTRLTNGGASNDALLSGKMDMVISGGPNMLILWAKTNAA
jgi:hypothetical protein